MRILPDGTKVFLFRGGVYVQKAGSRTAVRTYTVRHGSRPVSLSVSRDGLVVFGEYWSNVERAAVHVIGSRDAGRTWSEMYRFEAGQIRHIHGISYDPWEDCFWICAGDYEDENRLVRASPDFRDVRIRRQGGQGNRFYQLLVLQDVLLTATDTPLEENHICTIDKRSGDLVRCARIENSSYYNCLVGGRAVVSTNAEPTKVNDESATYVWMGTPGRTDWKRVLTFPVDRYFRMTRLPKVPRGLFQYPRVFFPDGENPGRFLVCHCIGVELYDDAMLCFDTAEWPN